MPGNLIVPPVKQIMLQFINTATYPKSYPFGCAASERGLRSWLAVR
jgi:hypothetical protein